MGTLVVSHKDTDEILQIQCGISDETIGYVIIDKRSLNRDDYICQIVQDHLTPNKFKKKYMVTNGKVVPKVATEEELLAKQIKESLKYLNSTDWYYARFLDTGKVVPEEVKAKRAEARAFLEDNGY